MHGQVNFNSDASFLSGQDEARVVFVARNSKGNIIMGRVWRCKVSSTLQGEALACKKAIKYAAVNDIQNAKLHRVHGIFKQLLRKPSYIGPRLIPTNPISLIKAVLYFQFHMAALVCLDFSAHNYLAGWH
jgi:hypothetical protein